jgi:hypothetical protein
LENSSMFYWIRASAYQIVPAYSEVPVSLKLQHTPVVASSLG